MADPLHPASQPGELIGMNIGPDEIHIMSREEV